MKGYEAVVVTAPELSEEELEHTLNQVKEVVTRHGGALQRYHLWGRRRLAYQIQNKTHGVYHVLYLTGTGQMIDELGKHFRYADPVLRFHMQSTENIDKESEFFLNISKPTEEVAQEQSTSQVQ